jgi:DNA-binding LytR/AlgR family response regulator
MTPIRILVAEDDPLHAAKMEMLLEQMGYELVGICPSADEMLRQFLKLEPDLVILDISLQGSIDGVSLAGHLNAIRTTPIIFATSFEDKETIQRALQENPYAYLVKPIELGPLQAAIELAFHRANLQNQKPSENQAVEWTEGVVLKDAIFIKAGGKLQKVRLMDILWIEVAEDRYCDVVTIDRKFHVRSSLLQLSEKLDSNVFARVHRVYMVNCHHITSIDENDMYLMVNNQSIPFGSTFKADLLKRLKLL